MGLAVRGIFLLKTILFELNFLPQTFLSAGYLVETSGGDCLPHPPRGRLRDGQGAGGRPLQGVRGSARGQQRAAPHRARRNEASTKGASAEVGSLVWRWLLQDGNSGCLAADFHPWGACLPVQVLLCELNFQPAAPQIQRYLGKYLLCVRFAYDGEWKFADLLTMTAGKLAVKFIVDG